MTNSATYPDSLSRAAAPGVATLLGRFWTELAPLADLLARDEQLLCAQVLGQVRQTVVEMMLALNGIAWPAGTRHLNSYLGPSQRAAIERTLLLPQVGRDGWIGQAVALTVIYRWYAPQLVEAFAIDYSHAAEATALETLRTLPEWPLTIDSD